MNNHPLISIIIPTFNRGHLIEQTLDSVRLQTYLNWECIVVDDGSNDNTSKILKNFCKKDRRFQYLQRPKDRLKGANACRNYGFELSKGDFIVWVDSDDICNNRLLEIQVGKLILGSKQVAVSRAIKFKNNDINDSIGYWRENTWGKDPLADMISRHCGWQTMSALWKREVISNSPFDEELMASQEWLFHVKQMHLLGKESFVFIDEVLSYIRISESGAIGNTNITLVRDPNYLKARNKLICYLVQKGDEEYLPIIFSNVSYLVVKILMNDKNNKELKKFEILLKSHEYSKWLLYKFTKMMILKLELEYKISKRIMLKILKD